MDAAKILGKTLVASPDRQQEADSDLAVVRKVQGGDVAAFDELVLKYRERVFGVVYHLTSNREDAADLTQGRFHQGLPIHQSFPGPVLVFHLALPHRG